MLLLGSMVFAVAPPIVQAQDQEDSEEAGRLEEVIVTARRRAEALMRTPVSITAFSGEEITHRQIERLHQIGQATPNLEFRNHANASGSNHNAVVYIRGVGQSDFVPSTQPGVGIYVDEAYISQVSGAVINLLDIESIQVLRGPQGTLFGRNTIGGAVLVNSVKPGDEFDAKVDLSTGTDKLREGRVSLNVPLSDTFFSRFSFLARHRDGWVDFPNIPGSDGGGSDDTVGARVALRWVPSDSLTIDLSADYTNSKSDGPPTVTASSIHNFNEQGGLTTAGEYNFIIAPALGLPLFTTEDHVPGIDSYTALGTEFDRAKQDIWGVNLKVQWDVGWGTLKSITNYRDLESNDGRDEDNSPLAPITRIRDIMDANQFSQEIQLSGQAFDERLDWTAGVYYFEDEARNPNPVDFPLFGLISGSIVEKQSTAIFGQGTYAINDQWSATFGLRYTDEKKDFIVDDTIQYVNRIWGPIIGAPVEEFILLPPNAFTLASKGLTEADSEEMDVYLNLSYQWTDDLMVYGSYATGFKGGGFVQRIVPGADVTSYDPEFADVYELGIKWEGLDQTLRLTGAVFLNDYTDLQITIERGIAPVTENAGDAEIKGFELEFMWLPQAVPSLTLSGGVGYLDAKYTKLDPGATVPKDNLLPSAPDWQYNLTGSYTLPADVFSGSLNFRLDYAWTDNYFMEATNDPFLEVDSYGLLNGAITWTSNSENWEVAIRGTNLSDELYYTSPQNNVGIAGWVTPTVGPPDQYSVRVTYRY